MDKPQEIQEAIATMFDGLPVSHLIRVVRFAAGQPTSNKAAQISTFYGLRALAFKLDKRSFDAICQQIVA